MAETVMVRKRIGATREELYNAWTNPERMSKWMCPGYMDSADVTLEPRVGGTLVVVMHHSEGSEEHRGEIKALDPPKMIAFTWISNHTHHLETLVTVEFLMVDEAMTEVVLTHEKLPNKEEAANHEEGWTMILDLCGEIEGH